LNRATLCPALAIRTVGLAGCSGGFDMDKLDIFGLSEKKKLPGERKDLFPGGVPGVTQGIPPEYIQGNPGVPRGCGKLSPPKQEKPPSRPRNPRRHRHRHPRKPRPPQARKKTPRPS